MRLKVLSYCGLMDPEATPLPHAPAGVLPLAGEVMVMNPAGCKKPVPAPNTAPDPTATPV